MRRPQTQEPAIDTLPRNDYERRPKAVLKDPNAPQEF
jgi:hypothetical protein